MTVISISLDRMEAVIDVAQKFSLDFDDAYQYAVAEEQGLILVSFDADFDRHRRGEKNSRCDFEPISQWRHHSAGSGFHVSTILLQVGERLEALRLC
jgi:hypothetical protein